jgi:hypothetical protein
MRSPSATVRATTRTRDHGDGDESTTDSVRNQADNEFRIRYNGGIRLR